MELKKFLGFLDSEMLIKVNNRELSGDDAAFIGRAQDCPYWIAEFKLWKYDGWVVDKDGYLSIECIGGM